MTQPEFGAITVLIPTFNRRERLQRALESVIEETRIPLEVHIFDNASTDDTALYATAMVDVDLRIRYFKHPTNIGAKNNYEFAFDSVHTKYFLPLADDDWLLPNFLFYAWNILQQQGDIGAAIFVTEQRRETGELLTTYPSAFDKIGWGRRLPKEHLRDLLTYGHYAWSSILWRSEVLSFMKGNYFCGGLASDVDFQVQIFCKYPVFLVNQSGAVYLTHDTQTSRGYNVLSVPGWASLFGRMDRSIRKFGVFETAEYSNLRSLMLSRYRPTWRSTENVGLRTDQIFRIAVLVGYRLEDWDFAYSLMARVPTETLVAKVSRAKVKRANRQRIESMSKALQKKPVPTAQAEIDLMSRLAERKAQLRELLLPLCHRVSHKLGLVKWGALAFPIYNASKSRSQISRRPPTLNPPSVGELRAGDTLSFTTGGNGGGALLVGWGQPEREGTWSIGESSVLKLLITPARSPLQISLRCTPFLHPSHPELEIACTLDDQIEYWQFAIDREPFTPSLTIPLDAVDADNSVTIKLDIRNPIAPAACNVNSDTRLLGIMLHSIDAV